MKCNSIFFCMLFLLVGIFSCTDPKPEGTDTPKTTESDIPLKASEILEASNKSDDMTMSNATNYPVPTWISNIMSTNPDEVRVMRCKQSAGYYYLINTCVNCPEGQRVTEIFDENKKLICYIGGPQQVITCEGEFAQPGKKDCVPIQLRDHIY